MIGRNTDRILENVVTELELPQTVQNNARELLEQAYDDEKNTGKSCKCAVAASVYAAAKIQQVGVFSGEVADVLGIDENRLFNELKDLENEVQIEIPFETPEMFITQIATDLDLNDNERTITAAEAIVERVREDEYLNGKSASGIAAAVVYITGCHAEWINDTPTQKEVADAAGVCAVTIRNHYQTIQSYYPVTEIINTTSDGWSEASGGQPASEVAGVAANATVLICYTKGSGNEEITVYKQPDETLRALISAGDAQTTQDISDVDADDADNMVRQYIKQYKKSPTDDLGTFAERNKIAHFDGVYI